MVPLYCTSRLTTEMPVDLAPPIIRLWPRVKLDDCLASRAVRRSARHLRASPQTRLTASRHSNAATRHAAGRARRFGRRHISSVVVLALRRQISVRDAERHSDAHVAIELQVQVAMRDARL